MYVYVHRNWLLFLDFVLQKGFVQIWCVLIKYKHDDSSCERVIPTGNWCISTAFWQAYVGIRDTILHLCEVEIPWSCYFSAFWVCWMLSLATSDEEILRYSFSNFWHVSVFPPFPRAIARGNDDDRRESSLVLYRKTRLTLLKTFLFWANC